MYEWTLKRDPIGTHQIMLSRMVDLTIMML